MAVPAFAVDVTYSTTGSFTNCTGGFTCGGSSITGANSLTIAFTGIAAQVPNITVPPLSTTSFGQFTQTGPTTGSDTGSAQFSLQVKQTVPTPGGTETLSDQLSGTITKSNDGTTAVKFTSLSGSGANTSLTSTDPVTGVKAFQFTFLDPTLTSSVTYWVDQSTAIVPPTVNNGVSTIQGAIDSTVPEPAFYSLTGTGFAGLLFMALRRRRQKIAS
jgi:hypothetical protein